MLDNLHRPSVPFSHPMVKDTGVLENSELGIVISVLHFCHVVNIDKCFIVLITSVPFHLTHCFIEQLIYSILYMYVIHVEDQQRVFYLLVCLWQFPGLWVVFKSKMSNVDRVISAFIGHNQSIWELFSVCLKFSIILFGSYEILCRPSSLWVAWIFRFKHMFMI